MVTRLSDKYTISRVGRSGRSFSVIRTPLWSASNSALGIVHSMGTFGNLFVERDNKRLPHWSVRK